ncbi:armadillo-type protein [Blastocladiella britannica]|nr:armadillo-type protein [Blastocladiella britannica]
MPAIPFASPFQHLHQQHQLQTKHQLFSFQPTSHTIMMADAATDPHTRALVGMLQESTLTSLRAALAIVYPPAHLPPPPTDRVSAAQAQQYLERAASDTQQDGWLQCLAAALVVDPAAEPHLVFLGFQALERAVAAGALDPASEGAATVRGAVWSYACRMATSASASAEAVTNALPTTTAQPPPPPPAFLRNKLAQVITLLVALSWPACWPTFWDDLFALLPDPFLQLALIASQSAGPPVPLSLPSPTSTPGASPITATLLPVAASAVLDSVSPAVKASARPAADLVLRIALAVDQDIVNVLIHRDAATAAQNQLIKDRMREGPVQQLMWVWYALALAYADDEDMVVVCLKNVSSYISWVDISLVINDRWLPLLHSYILSSTTTPHAVRVAALECMNEIVSKGMLPVDKLNLIQGLGVLDVLGQLAQRVFPTDVLEEGDEELDWVERLGKCVGSVGTVLVAVWYELQGFQSTVTTLLRQLFPIYIRFYSEEWDHVHQTVSDLTAEWINLWKRMKKNADGSLEAVEPDMVAALLCATIDKLKYHVEQRMPTAPAASVEGSMASLVGGDETNGGTAGPPDSDDEDHAEFLEMRRALKVTHDNIAQLAPGLWAATVGSRIANTLDALVTAPQSVPWPDAELALHLVYLYGEATKVAATAARDRVAAAAAYRFPDGDRSLTPLGQLLARLVSSGVILQYQPSATVVPLYLEIVARYAGFFSTAPEHIPAALDALVGALAAGRQAGVSRTRAAYLLSRFVKEVKPQIAPYIEHLLQSLAPLMALPPPPTAQSVAAAARTEPLPLLMDVFEVVGLCMAHDEVPGDTKAAFIAQALAPLMQALQAASTGAAAATTRAVRDASVRYAAGVVNAAAALVVEFPAVSFPGEAAAQAALTSGSGRPGLGPRSGSSNGGGSLTRSSGVRPRPPSVASVAASLARTHNNNTSTSSGNGDDTPLDPALLAAQRPWIPVVAQATDLVLAAASQPPLVAAPEFRDAARIMYQRGFAVVGPALLPSVRPLVALILRGASFRETADLLNSLGMVMYRARSAAAPVMDELVQPCVALAFRMLAAVPAGTDDSLAQLDVRRAYLSFLGSLVTLGLDLERVLLSQANFPVVAEIINSVAAIAMDLSDRLIQRTALGLLGKFTSAWVCIYAFSIFFKWY